MGNGFNCAALSEPGDRLLGFGSSMNDRGLVAFEHIDPRGEIRSVAVVKAGRQTELGRDEGLAETGDQFFKGIGLVAKALSKLALQPVLGTGCVNTFMRAR